MSDAIRTRTVLVDIQENGIIRNASDGLLIGRLVDGVNFKDIVVKISEENFKKEIIEKIKGLILSKFPNVKIIVKEMMNDIFIDIDDEEIYDSAEYTNFIYEVETELLHPNYLYNIHLSLDISDSGKLEKASEELAEAYKTNPELNGDVTK